MISRSEVVHARLSFVKGIPDTALSKSQHPQMIWSSQLKKFRHAKKVFDVTYLDLHQENVSI